MHPIYRQSVFSSLQTGLMVLLLFCSHTAYSHQAPSPEPLTVNLPLRRVFESLERWRPHEAEQLLQPLLRQPAHKTLAHLLLARIRYYQGQYSQALQIYQKAASPKILQRDHYYLSLQGTLKVTQGYQQAKSPHFTISYPPGKDQILVPYALEALEKAYARLGELYGYRPKQPVRVEILPAAEDLAQISSLTEADILRTGTIALCKYNRLMITSPRSLLRGYGWLDTLVHEYTHLVIGRIAAGVPIWLHEGLARYSEALWRTPQPIPLSPYAETLLAQALRQKKLIPFQQMHPSMAKLPSQKDAALAFAQVYMVIRYLVQQKGQQVIPGILTAIQKGQDAQQAVEAQIHMPFARFLAHWRQSLRRLHLQERAFLLPERKIFKTLVSSRPAKTPTPDPEKDLWYRPTSPQELGQRYLQLGEMLRTQGRLHAALFEYKKAESYWKNHHPSLQNKMAQLSLQLRQYPQALAYLKQSLLLYPDHVTTFTHLGQVYLYLKRYNEALAAFERSNQLNPFNPLIHVAMAKLYQMTNDPLRYKREQHVLAILTRE